MSGKHDMKGNQMLEFTDKEIFVLDNVTDEIIYHSNLDNIVNLFEQMNEASIKSMYYFELSEREGISREDEARYFNYSQEYSAKLNGMLTAFNTLFRMDIRSYMIFTIEDNKS